ncbi:MAG: fumarylacetoacetate hydrolase family protein [Aggregatilineales bacterium]
MGIALIRFYHPQKGVRIGVYSGETVYDVTEKLASSTEWFQKSVGRVNEAIEELENLANQSSTTYQVSELENAPSPDTLHWLAPVDQQEVWASGVTYERSREARQEESVDGGDIYARVYAAERPELFMKAVGWRVVGHRGAVGIRHDSTWSVPEPELALALNPALEVIGFSVANDMSSRDIEGENPLYLPQAKMYTASCALGAGITLQTADSWPETTIRLKITRDGETAFEGSVETARIHRKLSELVEYLGRAYTFPDGVVLLTGTGLVPSGEFTLAAGDVVEIAIDDIGKLINTVKIV